MKPERRQPEIGVQSAATWPVPPNSANWRERLPLLGGEHVVLRELNQNDGSALCALFAAEEVSRFISRPPSNTLEACACLIEHARAQRAAGTAAWFVVTLRGFDTAVGVFQVRATEPSFGTAEWECAIGSSFWGTGIFQESAALVLEFAFATLGVHRLETRVAVRNGRGVGALRKVGAVQEGLLRKSFLRDGEYLDQVLCTIVDDDWRARRAAPRRASVHVH